jgi:fumarate reductase subunit D
MTDPAPTPIVVTSAQGVTDALQALIRYLVVIVGFFAGLGKLIGQQNAVAATTYVQDNLGGLVAAVFGLIALFTAAWGIYKTFKRGSQVATVAASDAVPNRVAHLK